MIHGCEHADEAEMMDGRGRGLPMTGEEYARDGTGEVGEEDEEYDDADVVGAAEERGEADVDDGAGYGEEDEDEDDYRDGGAGEAEANGDENEDEDANDGGGGNDNGTDEGNGATDEVYKEDRT